MTPEQQREQAIQQLADLLRVHPFKIEYQVKKKPQGIKVIFEVTQEQMDAFLQKAARKGSK